jgi:hypothetical protein
MNHHQLVEEDYHFQALVPDSDLAPVEDADHRHLFVRMTGAVGLDQSVPR